MPNLTAKQSRFVAEYLIDLNGAAAAIRAGYSAKSAKNIAAELMRKPAIRAAINAAKIDRNEETKIDAAWVLKRLAIEAEADFGDLFDDKGDIKPVAQWPKIWRQGLVAGLEVEALFEGFGDDRQQIGVVKKLKLSDRVRRLELIGKHVSVNAFQETVNVAGVEALADRIARAKERRGTK